MSSDQASGRAKQTLKTMKELLDKAEDTTHKALEKAAPALQKTLDSSMEAASKGFAATMKSIDGATLDEQATLLRAYRKVLGGQVEFVDARIQALEKKRTSKPGSV
jgi:vacuolar-type H+-ATPase subunit E/Vma4